jgi:hypothetical protein
LKDIIILSPETYAREIEGPLIIRKPISIDGMGATIYAVAGPVVRILAESVYLKNLKIEVTGENLDGDQACALDCSGLINGEFRNVEICGEVKGLPGEKGSWQCPRNLNLGRIAPAIEHFYRIAINVPVETRLESSIAGVYLDPGNINPGQHMITIKTDALPNDIWLDGTIDLLTSHFKRCIRIHGQTCRPTDDTSIIVSTGRGQLIWEAAAPPKAYAPPEPPKPEKSVRVTDDPSSQQPPELPAVSEPVLHTTATGGVKLTKSIPGQLVVNSVEPAKIPVVERPKPSTYTSGIGQAFRAKPSDSDPHHDKSPSPENKVRQAQDNLNENSQLRERLMMRSSPKGKNPPGKQRAKKADKMGDRNGIRDFRTERKTSPSQKPDIRVFEGRSSYNTDDTSTDRNVLPVDKTGSPAPAKDMTENNGKIDANKFKKAFGP